MAEEMDEIDEALAGSLRTVITTGAQIGERLARGYEGARRRAWTADERTARELSSLLEAAQRVARVELANVQRGDWWDRATPEQIGRMYETARAWSREDPEAARAEQRIGDEVQTRYGVDVGTLLENAHTAVADSTEAEQTFFAPAAGKQDAVQDLSKAQALDLIEGLPADTVFADDRSLGDVRDWTGRNVDVDRAIAAKFPDLFADAERLALAAEDEQRRADSDRQEADHLMSSADQDEHRARELRPDASVGVDAIDSLLPVPASTTAAEAASLEQTDATELQLADVVYDSAQRRSATAHELESASIEKDVIATRMRADISQATPATAAVHAGATSAAPAARRSRSRGAQVHRKNLDR